MRNIFSLCAVLLCLASNAQSKKKAPKGLKPLSFTINGTTEGYQNGFIIFSKILSRKSDTVKVFNSKFTYQGTMTEPMSYVYIRHDNKSDVFFMDAGKHDMKIIYDNKTFTISNSPSQDSYNTFAKTVNPLVEKRGLFQNVPPGSDSLEAERQKADTDVNNYFAGFVSSPTTPPSVSSFLILSNIEQMQGAPATEMERLYNMLTPEAKNTTLGKYTFNTINRSTADDMGKIAPDFTLKDQNGKPVTLSSYRGSKYVLVDFWATWCGPCRAEFPSLKAAQEKYKDKLVILGVSIDKDQSKWISMINQPNYTNWTHVWDGPQGPDQISGTLYNVPSIPRNFLLDLNGKVIARNLRGPAVESELERLVK